MTANPYRQLPSVNDVLDTAAMNTAPSNYPHELLVTTIRHVLEERRRRLATGVGSHGEFTAEMVARDALCRLCIQLQPKVRPVINATGILLHTNLGRAPLADAAAQAAHDAGRGYLNLELDLATGKRSSRQNLIREWICLRTGAESATAVNNNAAATVIALRALGPGKEVIISRGQLIEIGGSFRIPDIMGVSGGVLREVGTTNITRLADYEQAIGPNSGALLQVHTSNYRIRGFTESVPLNELVALGKKHGLPVIDDVGSGALVDFRRFGFADEPMVRESVTAGADLVLFSADKLLGGPQAGIVAGRKTWIQKIESDPLMRAFRLDKMSLAALEATLRIYVDEDRALSEIPVLQMLAVPLPELRQRAESLAVQIRALPAIETVNVCEDDTFVGGGSLPDQRLKTCVLEISARDSSATEIAYQLRTGTPAVLGRTRDDKTVLDLRTVFPRQEDDLLKAVRNAFSEFIARG